MSPKADVAKQSSSPDLQTGPTIVPTITTDDRAVFEQQFTLYHSRKSIHLDYSDGTLAPSHTLTLEGLRGIASQVATPTNDYRVDKDKPALHIHVMTSDPRPVLDDIIALRPRLVYLHAESQLTVTELSDVIDQLWAVAHCSVSLAISQDTDPDSERAKELLTKTRVRGALIFGGKLGYQGGTADLTQLRKIPVIRAVRPDLVIAWDGGANIDNVDRIRDAGVQIINVGSAVSRAKDPLTELALLDEIVTEDDHEIPLCNNCD